MKLQQDLHNDYQRAYFDSSSHSRLKLGETPYLLNHLNRMICTADLKSHHSILEVGAGPGKFTIPLLQRGYQVTPNDLSPILLEQLKQSIDVPVPMLCGDIARLKLNEQQRFDKIIGFFVLHHLLNFDKVFSSLFQLAKPGAKIAFCEPVAWNPLYYMQILLTPSMRFSGEPSITSMRPGVILPAMARAGFVETNTMLYGYFPPLLKNNSWFGHLENWLDKRSFVPFPHAFQIFTARRPR